MDEKSPALEAVGKAHPEQMSMVEKLQEYTNAKLYHQLTNTLMDLLKSPAFLPPNAGTAAELMDLFTGFIQPFEAKLDKVRWVQILAVIAKPQTTDVALDLIAPFEASVSGHRDARFMWQALKAEKLTLSGQIDTAKELLETVGKEIEAAYEVDALIQSTFHKTYALLWEHLNRAKDYYQSSLLYLAFTPLSSIPVDERPALAFAISVAALVAEDEFNFGELMEQELLASLDGTQFAWIKDFLQAFAEGKYEMYNASLTKHRAQVDATQQLKEAEDTVLRPKMAALSLMELAFRKPKKQRRLSFDEVAQHCRVGPKDVEHLVMRAMCGKLICGKIDEVEQLVIITWVKPRILDNVRVGLLRERMDAWAAQTGLLLEHLEEMTPELLVS